MMMDWLRVYNKANIIPFIKAVDKPCQQYDTNEIDILKDAVTILGILMTYVLNKALKMKKHGFSDLYAPGQPCLHKYKECEKRRCTKCKRVWNECDKCSKNSHTNC